MIPGFTNGICDYTDLGIYDAPNGWHLARETSVTSPSDLCDNLQPTPLVWQQ